MDIREAKNKLALEYLISQKYPEVNGCGIGKNELVLYLSKKTKHEWPSEYEGFPLVVQITGRVKIQ